MKDPFEIHGAPDAESNPKGMGFFRMSSLYFFQLDIVIFS